MEWYESFQDKTMIYLQEEISDLRKRILRLEVEKADKNNKVEE